jgi:hypothetical protein
MWLQIIRELDTKFLTDPLSKKNKGQHIVDHINFVRIVRLQRLNICSVGGRLSFGCNSFGRVSY